MSRCFAFSLAGVRCEAEAGHEGDHQVVLAWSDEECWTPQEASTGSPPDLSRPLPPSLAGADQLVFGQTDITDSTVCMVCEHPWHEDICDQGLCGCRKAVA